MMFLTTLPLWLSGILVIGPPTLIAMAGPVIIRRYVKLSRLRTNNEIAGFKFATVGVIYAVLLAFAIIIVWEKFNDADGDGRQGGWRRGDRLPPVERPRRRARRRAAQCPDRLSHRHDRQGLAGDGTWQRQSRL